MFESSDETKVVHGRVMVGAFETVLVNNAHKRELCLTENCLDFHPSNVTKSLDVKIQSKPWPRKEEEKETEYFCRNLYYPHKGSPSHLKESQNGNQSVIEDDANLMPKTYVICQFVLVDTPSSPVQLNPNDASITVRRFYRPGLFRMPQPSLVDGGQPLSRLRIETCIPRNKWWSPGPREAVALISAPLGAANARSALTSTTFGFLPWALRCGEQMKKAVFLPWKSEGNWHFV
nr:DNA (cytosine-5)-methyltransferase 1-like [Ipomoea trifida]